MIEMEAYAIATAGEVACSAVSALVVVYGVLHSLVKKARHDALPRALNAYFNARSLPALRVCVIFRAIAFTEIDGYRYDSEFVVSELMA